MRFIFACNSSFFTEMCVDSRYTRCDGRQKTTWYSGEYECQVAFVGLRLVQLGECACLRFLGRPAVTTGQVCWRCKESFVHQSQEDYMQSQPPHPEQASRKQKENETKSEVNFFSDAHHRTNLIPSIQLVAMEVFVLHTFAINVSTTLLLVPRKASYF